jgi:uncharacterized membrane protein
VQRCRNLTKDQVNAFDLKAALLAKHAQHPVVIHFPIALFIISVAFDLFGIWKRNPTMVKAAYYNLVAAALTAPVAIATGLTAWQWQLEGAKLKGNLLISHNRVAVSLGSASAGTSGREANCQRFWE